METANRYIGYMDTGAQLISKLLPKDMGNWVSGISSGIKGIGQMGQAGMGWYTGDATADTYAKALSGAGAIASSVGSIGSNYGQPDWAKYTKVGGQIT